jgi:glyoxylase-like metal-dependent hydrolase (beta-lactamase superfamily II)
MRSITLALILALSALPAAAQTPPAQTPAPPVREITNIAGEVYRFRNNAHYSVFAVTSAGIIATDPINAAAATWLKDEMKKRWPDKAIKFAIYSHDHADHISGGEVWDTATFIAQDNARDAIVGEKRPTVPPQITYSDNATIELGGTRVELHYVGRNHSNNSTVLRFPKERVLFAVDFIPVHGVAFRDFPDAYLDEWIDSLRKVEAMDFDILVPGHGPIGRKADVAAFRGYLEDLRGQVLAAARAGKSLEETKKSVDLSKYKDWAGYEQMSQLNIDGVYRLVQATRRPNQ